MKRKIVIGGYDTAANGWTLTACKLSDPALKANYVNIPGGDGSWDLSTALTDGQPRYSDRTLTVTLECSEGDRLSRETLIRQMINQLDGLRYDIELPDDSYRHINGRVHIARNYSDLAHASVTVTATCKPWRYNNAETIVTLTAKTTTQTARLVNNGRLAIVPLLTVSGSGASIRLEYGSSSLALSAGEYQWPDLLLTPGAHTLAYTGAGTLKITYREAVLE